jgi:hypothetical protein
MLGRILKFAARYKEAAYLYKEAASPEVHRWASDIVNQAFQQVMGRQPTPAERQIVMAVSDLESSYGRGWGHGQSTGGQGSHNWGAIQTRSRTEPSFTHGDSSVQGKYQTRFKAYPDDVAGAADVVSMLFKGSRKQQMPDPEQGQRTLGGEISGPGRGDLIEAAAQAGDTLAFSKAMWYTTYFEGVAPEFTQRIMQHAQGIQNRVNSIASALGESPAWSIKSDNFLPVTSDRSVINKILQINPRAGGSSGMQTQPEYVSPAANTPVQMPAQQWPAEFQTQQTQQEGDPFAGLFQTVWFE